MHVTWYYTAYCIYVYTKAREDEFRELYRSYWRLAGLTDELWRTALVFTKSTSVKTGGQAPPLPNASYTTDVWSIMVTLWQIYDHYFMSMKNKYKIIIYNINLLIVEIKMDEKLIHDNIYQSHHVLIMTSIPIVLPFKIMYNVDQ